MPDKSPLNYIGGKYKMLPRLLPFFPKKINTMYDLFAGGCDVCTNITANRIYANDINYFVIDIYRAFQTMTIDALLSKIYALIRQWDLSMTNQEGYLALRKHYNAIPIGQRDPIELYVLVCYSFNYQFRFNSRHEFNNPFGRNRSSFNPAIRQNLITFHNKLKNITFSSRDFKELDLDFLGDGDFLYADPPYRITTASYNDGKRGFQGWTPSDDLVLFNLLDRLDRKGVKFALSNVTEHKGHYNEELITWKRHYHTHRINYNYNNSNYHAQNTELATKEVLITNY